MSDRTNTVPATTRAPDGGTSSLRLGLALLAGGAGVEAVARLLIVPWYDEPDRYVESIADHRTTHIFGAAVSMLAAAIIAAGLVRVWTAVGSQGRAARVSSTLAILLPLGLGGVAAVAFTAGSYGRDGDLDAAIATWEEVWDNGGADLGWYVAILGALALTLVLFDLARRRVVPRPAAVVTASGALTTTVTSAGPITGLLVATALLLCVGAAWSAARIAADEGEEHHV